MADYLGQVTSACESDSFHLGLGNCDKQEGKTTGLILTGANATYNMDAEAFIAAIHANTISDGADRMTILSGLKGAAFSGGDFNTVDDGTYGEQKTTNLSARTDTFTVNGGDCRYKELSKLNKKTFRVFRYDDEGYLYGTVKTKGGESVFAGYLATIYVRRIRPDGSAAYGIEVAVSYSASLEKEEKNMNAFSVGDLPGGLIGIILKAGTAGTASVLTACSGQDITSDYGDEWDETMFVDATGANPTNVDFDGDTGLLTIAPAGAYRPASAKILDAGNVAGFEGVGAYVQITA